jgi:hypothetical protein
MLLLPLVLLMVSGKNIQARIHVRGTYIKWKNRQIVPDLRQLNDSVPVVLGPSESHSHLYVLDPHVFYKLIHAQQIAYTC